MRFLHKLYITGTVIAACLAATISVKGQDFPGVPGVPTSMCGPRMAIIGALAEQYREIPIARGLGDDGTLYELFVAPDGETWTIAGTRPGPAGLVTCIKATGDSWQAYPAPAKGA